eukprot:scaffold14804_cov84-Cylindrotheca_fusiformis.AAC.1
MDVVLLYGPLQIPIGVVEVKKPTEGQPIKINEYNPEIFGNGRVAGQHLNQLLALSIFGHKRPVGLVSTFNRCFLASVTNGEGNENRLLNMRENCHELKMKHEGGKKKREFSPPTRLFKEKLKEKEQEDSSVGRVLYCSDVIPSLDEPYPETRHEQDKLPMNAIYDVAMIAYFVVCAVKSLHDVYQAGFEGEPFVIQRGCFARRLLE